MTVMRVLLFVLHVCMLREYDGARLAGNAGVVGWMRCDCGECMAHVVQVLCLAQLTCCG